MSEQKLAKTGVEMNRLFGCLTLVYCGGIFALSSIEGTDIEFEFISTYDLVCHAILYAGLGWVAAMTLRSAKNPTAGWRVWVGPIIFVAAYGMTDEFHQSFVQGRMCAVSDWLADVAGGACVQLMFPLKTRLDKRRKAANDRIGQP